MRRYFFGFALLLLFIVPVGSLSAMVVPQGTLDAIHAERREVVIDRRNYSLDEDVRIYLESDPEQTLGFSALRAGQKVVYDLSYPSGQSPRIKVLVIQD
jgi:hypothetical protein